MSFTKFDPTDLVVSSDAVTAPAWSSNLPTLSSFFTGSSVSASSYYVDVYNTASSNINAAVQFSIAYGNSTGTGSVPLNPLVAANTPTRINFGQYRNIIYGDNEVNINFGTGLTSSADLIAIAIDRNRYKESILPGTFNIYLSSGSSANVIKLTDNSNDVTTVTYLDCGRAYDIVSGSNGSAASSPLITGAPAKGYTATGSYGLFLPDVGLILLNPSALRAATDKGGLGMTSISTVAGSSAINHYTNLEILKTIQSGSNFQLNSYETISSDYVFVRIKNAEYNYTTNPSFITGSGNLLYSNYIYNPQTYITTVGMYNNNNELLAVAKLSKPLVKDFTKEALIRVKLDW
jgi:hypothetical protein